MNTGEVAWHSSLEQDQLEAFRSEIHEQSHRAPDRPMQAFFLRSLVELNTNPRFRDLLSDYQRHNPHDSPAIGSNKLFRAAQQLVIPPLDGQYPPDHPNNQRDPNYPHGRQRASGWNDVYEIIDSDPVQRFFFGSKFIHGRVQSNIYDRGSAVIAAAELFGIKDLSLYSGGHSMGLVEKLIGLKDNNIFRYRYASVGIRDENNLMGYRKSPRLSTAYNRMVRDQEFRLSAALGVDMMPPTDPVELDWARSCSFRPNEFKDIKRRDLIQRLILTEYPSLRHLKDDYTLIDHTNRMYQQYPDLKQQRPNMALYSFSLYQSTTAERQQALTNGETIVDQTMGLVAVLDFVTMDRDGTMTYPDTWKDWDVNMYVKDMANKEAGWQHIFAIREGRAREIALGTAVTSLFFGALKV